MACTIAEAERLAHNNIYVGISGGKYTLFSLDIVGDDPAKHISVSFDDYDTYVDALEAGIKYLRRRKEHV